MKLKPWIFSIIILCILFIVACTSKKNLIKYSKDYVEVGKLLNTVQLPYTLRFNNENKQLLAVGFSHIYDINNPRLNILKELFQEFNPDIVLNEGG